MAIKPDTNAAVDFLLKQEPEGPWAITAITVPLKKGETKSLTTRTFGPGQEEKLRAFIDEHNGKRNLYYGLNPTIGPLNKKAERADIKSVDWLHVDIDARAGEPLDDEIKRILKQATKNLPPGVVEPSGIVFTGGGYQLIWRLEEPIPIDGDLAKAEDAKLYNVQLENRFGADRCHNIDRILRLPGTLNPDFPDRLPI